jgi:hypothetical protein
LQRVQGSSLFYEARSCQEISIGDSDGFSTFFLEIYLPSIDPTRELWTHCRQEYSYLDNFCILFDIKRILNSNAYSKSNERLDSIGEMPSMACKWNRIARKPSILCRIQQIRQGKWPQDEGISHQTSGYFLYLRNYYGTHQLF